MPGVISLATKAVLVFLTQESPMGTLALVSPRHCAPVRCFPRCQNLVGRALYWGEKALHRDKFRSPHAVLVALALQR